MGQSLNVNAAPRWKGLGIMSKHTKEPWIVQLNDPNNPKNQPANIYSKMLSSFNGSKYVSDGISFYMKEANAQRIVDCVNACENIDDPASHISQHERIVGHLYGCFQNLTKDFVDKIYGEGFYDDVMSAVDPNPEGESEQSK